MHQITVVIKEETLEKLKSNAKLEKRSVSNYIGHLMDNVFKNANIIKTNEISCKMRNFNDSMNEKAIEPCEEVVDIF